MDVLSGDNCKTIWDGGRHEYVIICLQFCSNRCFIVEPPQLMRARTCFPAEASRGQVLPLTSHICGRTVFVYNMSVREDKIFFVDHTRLELASYSTFNSALKIRLFMQPTNWTILYNNKDDTSKQHAHTLAG
jgi:hypothetical protein